MTSNNLRAVYAIPALLLLMACQTGPNFPNSAGSGIPASTESPTPQQAAAPQPAPRPARFNMPPKSEQASVSLVRVNFDLPANVSVGLSATSLLNQCRRPERAAGIPWNPADGTSNLKEIAAGFYRVLRSAGYNVVGNPSEIFASVSRDKIDPDYWIGGQVTGLKVINCDASWVYNKVVGEDVEIDMKITWQVFSRIREEVVFEVPLEVRHTYSWRVGKSDAKPLSLLYAEAVVKSAADLTRDRRFFGLVTRPAPAVADIRAVDEAVLVMDRRKLSARPIRDDIDLIRQSVVTLDAGAGGHGSGFFVSPTLIMTNHHVVQGKSLMRVILANGRRVLGEVVRKHAERDVALVQVEEQGRRPLPIRNEPLKVTEEVFAIGTPFDRELSSTVSKGIVSAFRSNRFGLEDIQADVDIHGGNSGGALLDRHGNVVGVTYAGISPTGTKLSAGLNFFVPIGDALDKLNIKFKDQVPAGPGGR